MRAATMKVLASRHEPWMTLSKELPSWRSSLPRRSFRYSSSRVSWRQATPSSSGFAAGGGGGISGAKPSVLIIDEMPPMVDWEWPLSKAEIRSWRHEVSMGSVNESRAIEQRRHRKERERIQAAIKAEEEAARSGQLEGLEKVWPGEIQAFKRWMRGKVLRSLITDIHGFVYAPAWVVLFWRDRHEFWKGWATHVRAKRIVVPREEEDKAMAWNALRRLVARAARDKKLAEYVDTIVRLNGVRGLVVLAIETGSGKA